MSGYLLRERAEPLRQELLAKYEAQQGPPEVLTADEAGRLVEAGLALRRAGQRFGIDGKRHLARARKLARRT